MFQAIISVVILFVALNFEKEAYTPYFDIISLLCTQLWIYQANKKFSFGDSLITTIIIMFAQGFTLQFFFLGNNIFSDFDNVKNIFVYLVITLILANPKVIKLQDRIAEKFELYPYFIVMVDKVGQALTVHYFFAATLETNQIFDSLCTFFIATLSGQVAIVILITAITENENFQFALDQLKPVSIENFIIYSSTSLIFLLLKNLEIITAQNVQNVCIIQFIIYSTAIYYFKRWQNNSTKKVTKTD